jgi:Flp pilus assembly protein TadD
LGPAEEAYRRALRSDPESAPAWNGLGIVQRARGDLDGASRSFTHIVARKPDDAAAQFNLAATSHQAAMRAGKTPRADSLYALSEGAFAACMGLGFRAEESRLRHAEVRLERGAPADAYQEASAMMGDPKYGASARFLAGRAAMAAGRPQDVVAVLAPVFQSDKLSDDGLDLLGSAYSKLGRPADAARVLRRAHERRPDDWQTAMNLGVALSQSGDLVGAEKVLRPRAEAHPNEPAVLQNLAAVLQRRGRRTEADKLLQRAEALR